MQVSDVLPVVTFACRHMQLMYGQTKMRQTTGVTMGSSLGGSIFKIVLAIHETQAVTGEGGARFVDDLRLFAIVPLRFDEACVYARLESLLAALYPPHIVLKRDAVNPTIGMCVFGHNQTLAWTLHVKGLSSMHCYSPSGV